MYYPMHRRKLRDADRAALLDALEYLCARRGWELVPLDAHFLQQEDQMRDVAHDGASLPPPLRTCSERARRCCWMCTATGSRTCCTWCPRRAQQLSSSSNRVLSRATTSGRRARGLKHFAIWNGTLVAGQPPSCAADALQADALQSVHVDAPHGGPIFLPPRRRRLPGKQHPVHWESVALRRAQAGRRAVKESRGGIQVVMLSMLNRVLETQYA